MILVSSMCRGVPCGYPLTHVDKPEKTSPDEIDEFFDGINIDLSEYKFDRDEANER